MRFLVDECTGPAVASWLLARNHDVFSVFDKARGMEDEDIIRKVLASKIRVLSRLLDVYADKIPDSFLVVTEKQVRFARN